MGCGGIHRPRGIPFWDHFWPPLGAGDLPEGGTPKNRGQIYRNLYKIFPALRPAVRHTSEKYIHIHMFSGMGFPAESALRKNLYRLGCNEGVPGIKHSVPLFLAICPVNSGNIGSHMDLLGSDHGVDYAVVTHPYPPDRIDYVHMCY